MREFIILFCTFFACSAFGMGNISNLAIAQESSLSKLRVTVKKYLDAESAVLKQEVDWIRDVKRRLKNQLSQKIEDSKMTEDSCLSQMALDFLADNNALLKKRPGNVQKKIVVETCAAIEFFFERDVVLSGWKKYEDQILEWEKWLADKTDRPLAKGEGK